jgi:cbb3-type cytochrome oxidase subunit 3
VSLSDVMSALELVHYPEIALVIFLIVFIAVSWRAVRRPAGAMRHAAMIPLDGGDGSGASRGEQA